MTTLLRVGLGSVLVALMWCWLAPVALDNQLRLALVGGAACCGINCNNPIDEPCPTSANCAGPALTFKKLPREAGAGLSHIIPRGTTPCGTPCPVNDEMKGNNGCINLDDGG
jgi:hypothetical protein